MKAHPLVKSITANYANAFGGKHIVVRSPGRVNIIGEHTDYNEGFVLPAAIDKAAYIAIGRRDDKSIKLFAQAFNESYESHVEQLLPTEKGWPNYVLGVADQLVKRGYNIQGFNLILDSDVPIGSGVSSSAAIECSVVFALNDLFQLNIPKMEMALIAQKAEHTFPGVMCGIMDQFASLFGKKDHVVKLDCRSLEYEYQPLQMPGMSILLLNTNVEHSLAGSEYNLRRAQCEEAAAMVRVHHPEVKSLRDVNMEMLRKYVEPVNKEIFRRCKYVVEENARLLEVCDLLKQNDLTSVGNKMFETHKGLSEEYNVSCKELDFLVDHVKGKVIGARMMGGGFGGCTINIIKDDQVETLIKELAPAYQKAMGREMTAFVAKIEEGTTLISS